MDNILLSDNSQECLPLEFSMGYFQVILAEFSSGQNRSCQETSDISFSKTLVTLTFPYTPLVEVKQA